MKKKETTTEKLEPFDKESFKAQFENAVPRIVTEMSDLLERPVPRITKRDKRKISEDISWGIDVFTPNLTTLEKISGDLKHIDQGYEILEGILRRYLQRAKVRRKPDEDAFDCFLRKSASLLKSPSVLSRLKQFRMIRGGLDQLVHVSLTAPNGMKASRELIEGFANKHFKEYMRFANSIDARINSYRTMNLRRLTPQNVSRLTDIYRDCAAAFETRLRLLVGLNFIARRKIKTYDQLRANGYNQLFQAVDSKKNPLLHFLKDTVNTHVRNAMAHNGVHSSRSKGTVTFTDYSPTTKKETEVVWTYAKFLRQTRNLYLSILGVGYLEQLINYWQLYIAVTALRSFRTPRIIS